MKKQYLINRIHDIAATIEDLMSSIDDLRSEAINISVMVEELPQEPEEIEEDEKE